MAGLLVLGVIAVVGAVEGTPEFLEEKFGLFITVDDYGPRAVIATKDGYLVVGDDAKGNGVVWLSEDGERWARGPRSDALGESA